MAVEQTISKSWMRWVFLIVLGMNIISCAINRYTLIPIQDQLIDFYNISDVEYGFLMTSYAYPNMLWGICCGILIDKFSIKKVLISSWILTVFGLSVNIASCISKEYILLCIGRTIVGIGNEGIVLASKLYALSFFEKREYGLVFGIFLAFYSCGEALNTIITLKIYEWFSIVYSMAMPLFIAIVFSFPLFIFMYVETYKLNNCHTDMESTKLITDDNVSQEEKADQFKISDIKNLPIYYWLLLTGFVCWICSVQSAANISVSFIHNMFDVSQNIAADIVVYGQIFSVISQLISGALLKKIGSIMGILMFANVSGFCGHYINGWINERLFWAYVGTTLIMTGVGFSYPVANTAITLLVSDKTKGTAFGVLASTKFLFIAISFLIVGVLTNDSDGKSKYINVQFYILMLVMASTILYLILWRVDIKYNQSALRNIGGKSGDMTTKTKETDISLQKVSVGTISDLIT